VRRGAGHGLRRHAVSAEPDVEPGWDRLQVRFSDSGWFSEQVASFGADVVVIEPPDLRDAVIRRLKGVLA
jgi:proteasome accessory factor B